jgi:excisionase family DNA binding protein
MSKRAYRDKQAALMRTRGLYPIPEVADLIGMSSSTVYRWIDNGKVEGTTLGSARYVRIKSVREFMGRKHAAMLGL